MTRRVIGIVDYDVGNLASVRGAVERAGHRAIISADKERLSEADLLILPGVGAFPAAMQSLRDHDLVDFLKEWAKADRPLLGICLGMQLLADTSLENGETEGLRLIHGVVEPRSDGGRHIGWNQIRSTGNAPWLDGLDESFVYFNHSYYFRAANGAAVATASRDGEVVAAVQYGHVVGVQFHPEKSQDAGDKMMAALIEALVV